MKNEPTSTLSDSVKSPLVVKESDIEYLYNLLKEYITEPSIRAECKDKVTHNFSSLEELFNYSNSKSSKIVQLRFLSYCTDTNKHGSIFIDFDNSIFANMRYEIELPTKSIYEIQKKLKDVLVGTYPWYRILSKISYVFAGFALYIILWASLSIALGLGFIESSTEEVTIDRKTATFFWIFLFLYVASLFVLDVLNLLLFKRNFLLIGQQKQHYNNMEFLRKGIVVQILLSVLLAVLTALF